MVPAADVWVLRRVNGKDLQTRAQCVADLLKLLLHESAGTAVDGRKHDHQGFGVIGAQDFFKVLELGL